MSDLPADAGAPIHAALMQWLNREWPDGAATGTEYDIDHLASAFKAGWKAAAPHIAAAERARLLSALREFLSQYVGMVEQKYTLDGEQCVSYAGGPVAFPDALVDTFALVDTPDADLLDGES